MNFKNNRFEERLPGTPAYKNRREQEMEELDIYRINQQLQRIVRSLNLVDLWENEDFTEAVKAANHTITSSSVLNLSANIRTLVTSVVS